MESIIQQITKELAANISQKAFGEGISGLDNLAAEVFEDCAHAACLILQEILHIGNQQIREDKSFRKQEGLIIKEKARPRRILTKLSVIEWNRDYCYDKK